MVTLPWPKCKACIVQQVKHPPPVDLRHVDSLSNDEESVWRQENGMWSETASLQLSLVAEQWKSISYAVMNGATFLIRLSRPSCLFLKVKGRRTGRSRYSCGTRSVATGWETTSISTCTSAPHRVATGDSTHPTKLPLTVRYLAFPSSFVFHWVDYTGNIKIRLCHYMQTHICLCVIVSQVYRKIISSEEALIFFMSHSFLASFNHAALTQWHCITYTLWKEIVN